jgi:hypothetical protein
MKYTETLLNVTKGVSLEGNTEKTNNVIIMFCYCNGGQVHNKRIPNKSFENLGKFGLFGTDSNKSK